jgi:surfactin synthase thioesterase subunit
MKQSTRNKILVRLGSGNDNKRAVIVVPPAGAGVATFMPWVPIINDIAALWGARFPGRETRLLEPPLTTIEEMADSLVKPVKELDADEIVLFGHCSGAFVAYELAERITAGSEQQRDLRLVVSGQTAPASCRIEGARRTADLPLDELIDEFRKVGGTPPRVLDSIELMTLLEPGIRADLRAVEDYSRSAGGESINIPLTVIGGKRDGLVSIESLSEWRNYTSGPFEMHLLDAGHFYLMEPVVAQLLLDLILRR